MLSDNLVLLRTLKGLSQEEVADIIGISRQSYSKWELGDTTPDIEKCDRIAQFYGVSIDALVHQNNEVEQTRIAPAPIGKHLFGVVTLGEKGQIVIPKAARDVFQLTDESKLVVLGDVNQGIALVKLEDFEKGMQEALHLSHMPANKE